VLRLTVPPRILVHSPEGGEAARYADLVRAGRPDADIVVSTTSAEAQQAAPDAEILLGRAFPPAIFPNAARLRWIHKISAGVDDVAFNPGVSPDIVLTRTDGAMIAPRMVEYVLGAIFAIVQRFPRAWKQQCERHWESFPVGLAKGKTVGVAGLGDIGSAIAAALRLNGMGVVGWRRTPTECPSVERLYVGREALESFVAACDFVVLVLPATAETRNLFSGEVFAAMKPAAHLINVGRGAAVDEEALASALRNGRIAGAVLDVFADEPLPPTSPLWALEQVFITPHISGPIVPEDVVGCFLDNLDRYLGGEPLRRQIDRRLGY
jgi:glyoxylate/hydroxypyruvate reductase A